MELNFTVTNQRIKYVSNLYIVEKSKNYLTAKFSFSGSEWKNVAKTAIFKKDDNVINVLLDENGRCTVPWELITRGTLKVSVFGGDLVTVDTAEVKILKSGYEEGNAPSEPTSDVYAQILAELQRIRDDFITEEMLGQAVEDWLAENVVEALSPADVEKIVYDYLDEHKDELKGEKGAVFTPHVSDEGVMSWTNNGGLENPPPVDLKINAGSDYALLTEAGYSLNLSVDSKYVLTIDLLNKAGAVLSSKNVDLPLESMFINATYANGVITLTLQNGNTLDVDISDIVRGLVPTSRTIAGIDLEDDVTKEELQSALEIYDSTVMGGELKPWLYDTENEVVIGVYNGKPLYRKEFTINLTTDENGLAIVNISDYIENHENIINHKVFTMSMNLLPCIYKDVGNLDINDITYFVNVGSGIIVFTKGTNVSITEWSLPCIFEYTKTTDAEGSGNNLNPYGIYSAKLDEVKADIEELQNAIVTTDSTTLENSHAGRVLFNEIVGGMEQKTTSGKNLLKNTLTSQSNKGITVTRNDDGGLTLKGTATETAFFIVDTDVELTGDTPFILSGCPSGGSANTYSIRAYDLEKVYRVDLGSGIELPSNNTYAVEIRIQSGYTVNQTFYPMIRLATETDATYEPFTNGASPNPDYPQPINGSVISGVRVHRKNFLKVTQTMTTARGLAIEYLKDGGIRLHGTHSSSTDTGALILPIVTNETKLTLPTGTYEISGCPIGGSNTTYSFRPNGTQGKIDTGSGNTFTLTEKTTLKPSIVLASGTYGKEIDLTFYPMIRKADIEDDTFEPYQGKEITLSNPITLYNDVLGENVERKYAKFIATSSMVNSATKDGTVYINVPTTAKISSKAYCTHNSGVKASLSGATLYFTDSVNGVDADTYKAFLDNNEVEFVYELAESVIEELPTADKIALNSLPTYDGITYVEFIDVGVQPSVSIDYGTSKVGGMTLESLLTARNNDLRLSSLEASVVNNI